MPATATEKLMTADEFLALPEDGMDRCLVFGQLRERPLTYRNRFHSRLMVRISKLLDTWLDSQPRPRGEVLCGEAGVKLRDDPALIYGVDVVYISAEMAQSQTDDCTILVGIPELVVEILSPSDTVEDLDEKIDNFRAVGVPLIWLVDPHDKTVAVYRQSPAPQTFTLGQEIADEPRLPGLRLSLSEIFE